jgi:ferritin-like metal-binding protein YciE
MASSSTTAQSGTSTKKQGKSDVAQGLRDLFLDSLKDIYGAEKALTVALPKMAKNASSPELVDALHQHLDVTKAQVTRLEKVFAAVGEKAAAKKCAAMEGLIEEAEEIMKETEHGMVRDAGIILAGQKVEHYEIATYGTLCAFAKTLGEHEARNLLHETLTEEKDADEKLTMIAESFVNEGAADDDSTVGAQNGSHSKTQHR